MTEKRKNGLKISEMIARDELSPLKGMLNEYAREMEKMRAALEKAGAKEKNPAKKPAKKAVKKVSKKAAKKTAKKTK